MYVTLRTYYAREGEEDAIVALHEDWQRHLRTRALGYLAGELLHDIRHPRLFIAIAHYESADAATAVARDPEYAAWQHRLSSLCQSVPERGEFQTVWQHGRPPV